AVLDPARGHRPLRTRHPGLTAGRRTPGDPRRERLLLWLFLRLSSPRARDAQISQPGGAVLRTCSRPHTKRRTTIGSKAELTDDSPACAPCHRIIGCTPARSGA